MARRSIIEVHRGFPHPSDHHFTFDTSGSNGPYLRVGRFRFTWNRRVTRYKADWPDRVVWNLVFYRDRPKRGHDA